MCVPLCTSPPFGGSYLKSTCITLQKFLSNWSSSEQRADLASKSPSELVIECGVLLPQKPLRTCTIGCAAPSPQRPAIALSSPAARYVLVAACIMLIQMCGPDSRRLKLTSRCLLPSESVALCLSLSFAVTLCYANRIYIALCCVEHSA